MGGFFALFIRKYSGFYGPISCEVPKATAVPPSTVATVYVPQAKVAVK